MAKAATTGRQEGLAELVERQKGQVVPALPRNPNGSIAMSAAPLQPGGNVLVLMPHPEASLLIPLLGGSTAAAASEPARKNRATGVGRSTEGARTLAATGRLHGQSSPGRLPVRRGQTITGS